MKILWCSILHDWSKFQNEGKVCCIDGTQLKARTCQQEMYVIGKANWAELLSIKSFFNSLKVVNIGRVLRFTKKVKSV